VFHHRPCSSSVALFISVACRIEHSKRRRRAAGTERVAQRYGVDVGTSCTRCFLRGKEISTYVKCICVEIGIQVLCVRKRRHSQKLCRQFAEYIEMLDARVRPPYVVEGGTPHIWEADNPRRGRCARALFALLAWL
jgi:hypothetical protein